MKRINYTLYTLLMLFVSLTAYSAPPVETSHLSTTVFVFILSALAAMLVTYLIWRYNDAKRKQSPPKTVNRGPVKRPIVAYHRKRGLQHQH